MCYYHWVVAVWAKKVQAELENSWICLPVLTLQYLDTSTIKYFIVGKLVLDTMVACQFIFFETLACYGSVFG